MMLWSRVLVFILLSLFVRSKHLLIETADRTETGLSDDQPKPAAAPALPALSAKAAEAEKPALADDQPAILAPAKPAAHSAAKAAPPKSAVNILSELEKELLNSKPIAPFPIKPAANAAAAPTPQPAAPALPVDQPHPAAAVKSDGDVKTYLIETVDKVKPE
jgi:hypothetical protein